MKIIQEYGKLNKKVLVAHRELVNFEKKITVHVKQYHLSGKGNIVAACINKYDKVIVDVPKTAQIDDNGFTTYCHLFKSNGFCENRKCPLFALNADYVVALDRYNKVRQQRREFVRGAFKREK